jgi:glycosyltransferase involved in cell wall biosynthesis
VVDDDIVKPRSHKSGGRDEEIVLGWIGSHSTYPYLESLFPILQEVSRRHPFILRTVGAGREVSVPGVKVDNRRWSLKDELADLQSFDIGIYPIVHDNWSLGKSGFKAVQYMAVGIPAVCSPVGATCDIVEDGTHGFLPDSPQEWVEKLSLLIKDAQLRSHLGSAGRRRVEEWYSLKRQAPNLKAVLEQAAS